MTAISRPAATIARIAQKNEPARADSLRGIHAGLLSIWILNIDWHVGRLRRAVLHANRH
jgi:hypothetical protein